MMVKIYEAVRFWVFFSTEFKLLPTFYSHCGLHLISFFLAIQFGKSVVGSYFNVFKRRVESFLNIASIDTVCYC